jgi:hypothetical protein
MVKRLALREAPAAEEKEPMDGSPVASGGMASGSEEDSDVVYVSERRGTLTGGGRKRRRPRRRQRRSKKSKSSSSSASKKTDSEEEEGDADTMKEESDAEDEEEEPAAEEAPARRAPSPAPFAALRAMIAQVSGFGAAAAPAPRAPAPAPAPRAPAPAPAPLSSAAAATSARSSAVLDDTESEEEAPPPRSRRRRQPTRHLDVATGGDTIEFKLAGSTVRVSNNKRAVVEQAIRSIQRSRVSADKQREQIQAIRALGADDSVGVEELVKRISARDPFQRRLSPFVSAAEESEEETVPVDTLDQLDEKYLRMEGAEETVRDSWRPRRLTAGDCGGPMLMEQDPEDEDRIKLACGKCHLSVSVDKEEEEVKACLVGSFGRRVYHMGRKEDCRSHSLPRMLRVSPLLSVMMCLLCLLLPVGLDALPSPPYDSGAAQSSPPISSSSSSSSSSSVPALDVLASAAARGEQQSSLLPPPQHSAAAATPDGLAHRVDALEGMLSAFQASVRSQLLASPSAARTAASSASVAGGSSFSQGNLFLIGSGQPAISEQMRHDANAMIGRRARAFAAQNHGDSIRVLSPEGEEAVLEVPSSSAPPSPTVSATPSSSSSSSAAAPCANRFCLRAVEPWCIRPLVEPHPMISDQVFPFRQSDVCASTAALRSAICSGLAVDLSAFAPHTVRQDFASLPRVSAGEARDWNVLFARYAMAVIHVFPEQRLGLWEYQRFCAEAAYRSSWEQVRPLDVEHRNRIAASGIPINSMAALSLLFGGLAVHMMHRGHAEAQQRRSAAGEVERGSGGSGRLLGERRPRDRYAIPPRHSPRKASKTGRRQFASGKDEATPCRYYNHSSRRGCKYSGDECPTGPHECSVCHGEHPRYQCADVTAKASSSSSSSSVKQEKKE